MKKIFNWQFALGIILVALSAVVYYIHFMIFRDAHHIFLYMIGDIAFVFIEVLMVTLIIHNLLSYRDKKSMLKKLNMVIGTFFSEVGIDLLKILKSFDEETSKICEKLLVKNNWPKKEFSKTQKQISHYNCNINSRKGNLNTPKEFLLNKRNFLLSLLANPNLLEHESFTNLLWAVFHLTGEFTHRKSFKNLPEHDYDHLSVDIKRAYILLISEWLSYMQHLKIDYPYLFSLAIRTNPFDENASVEIK